MRTTIRVRRKLNIPSLIDDDVPAKPLPMLAVLTEPGIEFASAASGLQALRLKHADIAMYQARQAKWHRRPTT